MKKNIFSSFLSNKPLKVIDKSITLDKYVGIDLSIKNKDLNSIELTSSKDWETYIKLYLKKHNAEVAFGGYLEKRNLYNRSVNFINKDTHSDRNIHLGIDFWCDTGTNALAVLDGEVHSFQNNTTIADYGPTIILKHKINEVEFYSLYGHLSVESLADLQVGKQIQQGQIIGTLGAAAVNGDYAPHLHFQIILDMKDNFGDYVGVCSKNNIDFYAQNCPDPNLLLKLK